MIAILLLDTKTEEAETLKEEIRYLTARHGDEQLSFLTVPNTRKLAQTLKETDFLHVAIVDVTVSDGIQAAKLVRSRYPDVQILVIADMTVSPLAYLTPSIRPGSLLLRPCSGEQRHQIMEDFFYLAVRPLISEDDAVFWAKTKDGTQKIPFGSILYFEAREKKVFVRTRRIEYGIGGTIEALMDKLPDCFLRCHRSYIINRNYLERVRLSEGYAYLTDSIMIPISRSYKAQMKEEMHVGQSS